MCCFLSCSWINFVRKQLPTDWWSQLLVCTKLYVCVCRLCMESNDENDAPNNKIEINCICFDLIESLNVVTCFENTRNTIKLHSKMKCENVAMIIWEIFGTVQWCNRRLRLFVRCWLIRSNDPDQFRSLSSFIILTDCISRLSQLKWYDEKQVQNGHRCHQIIIFAINIMICLKT